MEGSKRGGFSSANDIPGGGAKSGFNEKCLGDGKGGSHGAGGGAGTGSSKPTSTGGGY